jgi:hypothetical protein
MLPTKNSRLAAAAEPEGGRLNSNYNHEHPPVKADALFPARISPAKKILLILPFVACLAEGRDPLAAAAFGTQHWRVYEAMLWSLPVQSGKDESTMSGPSPATCNAGCWMMQWCIFPWISSVVPRYLRKRYSYHSALDNFSISLGLFRRESVAGCWGLCPL